MRVVGLAVLMVAGSIAAAGANEMRSPRLSYTAVQWNEVAASLNGNGGQPAANLMGRLNTLTGELFAGIAASPVPVLLPFNTVELLRDHAAGTTNPLVTYHGGLRPPPFFQTGPGGYDAAFSIRAKDDLPGSGITYSDPIDVHISGSALLYDLGEPAGMVGWPVGGGLGGLDADFPGIKRNLLESQLRYTFVRFGVPYVVSIECHDGGARFRKVSCRDADKVAIRILKALQVAGGAPQPQPGPIEVNTVERPQALSTVFTYHAPGDLMPGSGMRGHSGRPDYTVYSKMRFPLADAPAYANSQSFMHWGDCDQTGRVSMGLRDGTRTYRCRVNDVPLVADESANYAYPWRDNFCEHRAFFVGECPGGLGHQGQDIRPSSCKQRIKGANRCEPYQHDVVAVRDGMVLRAPGQVTVYVVTNTASERLRFRYLHMSPKQLDSDGLLSGRAVREGEVIGKVGNYLRRERATTYHLHFDMQVPTKYGWVFVNPYMTLVAAYERQIHGRGQEVRPDGAPVAAADSVGETAAIASATISEPPASTAPAVDDRGPWPLVAPLPEQRTSPIEGAVIARHVEAHVVFQPVVPPSVAEPPSTAVAAAPAPAANPIERDLHWDALNRIASETAGDERKLSADP